MADKREPKLAAAEASALAELVAYQQDAIVSRTLVKREGGSVTLFAFDRGQTISEHSVPYDALAHVLVGAAEIRIDGVPHPIVSGEAILMPANRPHAVRAVERFKMVLTMLRA